MVSIRKLLGAAVLAVTGSSVFAQEAAEDEFTITRSHMDQSMHCEIDVTGRSFAMLNDNVEIIRVNDAEFTGYEDADKVDGRPLNGYAVINYPNLFNDHAGQEIWDIENVFVSADFQGLLEGNDVRLVLDFDDATEPDGTVSRERAHCRIEVTNPETKRHDVYFMPLRSPYIN